MDEFIKMPPGRSLFERLEEKRQRPITIIKKNLSCTWCAQPFTLGRQPSAELHSTPESLPLPLLYLLLLCQGCAGNYRAGGCERTRVVAAVKESLAREVSE